MTLLLVHLEMGSKYGGHEISSRAFLTTESKPKPQGPILTEIWNMWKIPYKMLIDDIRKLMCITCVPIVLFKRNANAFSLNAVVDVRRSCSHEMIFLGAKR